MSCRTSWRLVVGRVCRRPVSSLVFGVRGWPMRGTAPTPRKGGARTGVGDGPVLSVCRLGEITNLGTCSVSVRLISQSEDEGRLRPAITASWWASRPNPGDASDLHIIRGRYGFTPEFPTVPGIESVGVIDKLVSGTDGLTVGQRVITIGVKGTWQEYVVADAGRVLPVPAGMSNSTAALILGNPLTAVILTGDELDVRPGEWLLQTAAGSTVGQSVIQVGAHVGFKTLNMVRRRSAVEDILALGGNAVICTEDGDLRERVADIAGHDGVSKAVDCASGQVGADVSRALAPHGELVVYGALSTHRQTDPDKLTIPMFARSLIHGTKTVRDFWLFRWFTETPR